MRQNRRPLPHTLNPTPNPLNHRGDFSRPALRHGSLNSLFQVILHLPEEDEHPLVRFSIFGRGYRVYRTGRNEEGENALVAVELVDQAEPVFWLGVKSRERSPGSA